LPEPLRQLCEPYEYPVEIAPALQELARQIDLAEAARTQAEMKRKE
jgi:hypothetical protein